jgi:hypothetical protein
MDAYLAQARNLSMLRRSTWCEGKGVGKVAGGMGGFAPEDGEAPFLLYAVRVGSSTSEREDTQRSANQRPRQRTRCLQWRQGLWRGQGEGRGIESMCENQSASTTRQRMEEELQRDDRQ